MESTSFSMNEYLFYYHAVFGNERQWGVLLSSNPFVLELQQYFSLLHIHT